MKNPNDILYFLEDSNKNIKKLESEALDFLNQGNTQGHLERMQQKAQLLAGLSTNAKPYLQALPENLRQEAGARLGEFSENAAKSLEIGSVFFMSALLYPDEHKPGEPNNLELFIKELKTQL